MNVVVCQAVLEKHQILLEVSFVFVKLNIIGQFYSKYAETLHKLTIQNLFNLEILLQPVTVSNIIIGTHQLRLVL